MILYRNAELRSHQFYAVADWPGGIYGSPTVAGSRSGYLIACCWVTLMHYGRQGYIEQTRQIIQVARAIAKGYPSASARRRFLFKSIIVSLFSH